jgi:hypothetical protein
MLAEGSAAQNDGLQGGLVKASDEVKVIQRSAGFIVMTSP